MDTSILVTADAVYIGSHTTLTLLQAGRDVVVLDNLCKSLLESLVRGGKIRAPRFVQGDIRDADLLTDVFTRESEVIHCAGLKSVAAGVLQPLAYYQTNVAGRVGARASGKVVPWKVALPARRDCRNAGPMPPKRRRTELAGQARLARNDFRCMALEIRNPDGYRSPLQDLQTASGADI